MPDKMSYLMECLKPARDSNGHPITQKTFDMIEKSLRDIIYQYQLKPDGELGKGFTNKPFLEGIKALNYLAGVDD